MIFFYDDYGATKTSEAFEFLADYTGRDFAMGFVGEWYELVTNIGERHLHANIYVGF